MVSSHYLRKKRNHECLRVTSEFPLNSNFLQVGQLLKRSSLNTSALRVYLVLSSETISRQIKRIQNEGIILQTKRAFIDYYFLIHKKRRGERGGGSREGGSRKGGTGRGEGRQTLHKTFLNAQCWCAAGAGGFF